MNLLSKIFLGMIVVILSCSNPKKESLGITEVTKTDIPSDYISEDGYSEIKYYPNGRLKEVSVITNSYFDTTSIDPLLGSYIYTYQILEFSEEGKLKYCLVTANDSNWFEYEKDGGKEKISGVISSNGSASR